MRDADGFLTGWGMGTATFPAIMFQAEARAVLNADGSGVHACGTQDMGSGTYTVLAQLAAEVLGVPYANVGVALGDTLLPEGPYSGGSMASVLPS